MATLARVNEESAENPVRTSLQHTGLVIENVSHRLTKEVSEALVNRNTAHVDLLAIEHETDLTPEMRRQLSEQRRQTARTMSGSDVNFDRLNAELRDVAMKRSDQVSAVLKERIRRRELVAIAKPPKWSDLYTLAPVDHSFWWAQTQPHVAPSTTADFRDDGLHFWGGPKVNNYDGEMRTSFGSVASFALQPARFPTSPSGVFLSSPHVELFGGVVAFAPDWDLIQGNGIAQCELFLRQTIFQWGFGSAGPVALTIAEAKGYDSWRLYLKNTGYSRHADMPGFKLIPPVTYNQGQVISTAELWAEIEVRLDIYLNCTGALLWCDPDVLVRTFQWAATPLP